MREETLRIGLIGLDSSHSVDFTKVLNDSSHPYYVPGGQVTAAYKGGSPDMALSIGRVEGYTRQLIDSYRIRLVDDLAALADQVDAMMITSMDGRIHLEQFAAIAASGKPVFVNKPFAVSTEDAKAMLELAERYSVPIMSSSSLRYMEGLQAARSSAEQRAIFGADVFGPMKLEPQMPGLFWYGVHLVEMLYAVMGPGCVQVSTVTNDGSDMIIGEWADGRVGMLRGNRMGNNQYGCIIHRADGSQYIVDSHERKPAHVIMIERMMEMFRTGSVPIPASELLEVVRFMEAANESRDSGEKINLMNGDLNR